MTRDDIMRMAEEAGFNLYMFSPTRRDYFEPFAALVAAHEREACAKLCEQKSAVKGGEIFAARIRARGEKP